MSATSTHGRQDPIDGIHAPFNWTYADAATRNAHTPTAGPLVDPDDVGSAFLPLSGGDEGKFALQLNDNTIWMLIDFSVPTWTPVTATASVVALFIKDDFETTMIGTALTSKLQLDTLALFGGNIPAGTYKLDFAFTWRRASTSGDAQFDLVEDIAGAATIHWAKEKENQDASANQRNSAGSTDRLTLAAGDFTFDIRFANVAGFGGVTVGISQVRIWLIRVGP